MEHKRLEIKADSVQDAPEYCTFTGYAATFGNVDLVNDIIEKGAFTNTVRQKSKYPLYWDHSSREMIGSVIVEEDDRGLWVREGRVNKGTARGKDVAALLKGGDLATMSIGFMIKDYAYEPAKDGESYGLRIVKEIELREVSLVSDPANPQAKVASVKSVEAIREAKSLAEIEAVLREHDISREGAKAIISKVKEFSKAREEPEDKDASVRDESEAKFWNVLNAQLKQTVASLEATRT